MSQHKYIKIKAMELNIRLKDVAAGIDMEYNYFIQIINGFKKTPENFTNKIKTFFKEC